MRQNPCGFLQTFALLPIAVVTIGLAFNVLIDPLRRFDVITIEGINAQKPQFVHNSRLGKAGAVCRIEPAPIAMGPSRAELGAPAAHPGWDRPLRPPRTR